MSSPDSPPKKHIGCIILLGILILIFLAGLTALAATGFVRIPVLSSLLGPTPPTIVRVELTKEEVIQQRESLEEKIGAATFQIRTATPENPAPVTFEVTEKELTAVILSGEDEFLLKEGQVRILPEGLELSGMVTEPVSGIMKLLVQPFVNEGQVDFTVKEVVVGGLTLPGAVGDSIVKAALGGKINEANKNLEMIGTIDEIILEPGVLTLQATILDGRVLFGDKEE
ncbi:MAG: hypothetical protein HOJ15_02630 [Candidatus Jacksonbacteria bacterium]|jgi:hypothetical protein|nr:hypothetical protein [Candidatus Jacksonbacteria bacterium]MBT6034505.1 hypothetical protein [Candidatus Jacksonbacteria bacterium]MBT6301296.1 hypothetical protein [Candidatus Jacksonbacteria bacterium]MBT6756838.1 hypothetical protein [Candidatus Jacksonbacteria bacterium]MBT6955012.1 hypothetical protein [Candidatus Jacksonbacteria bacterium]